MKVNQLLSGPQRGDLPADQRADEVFLCETLDVWLGKGFVLPPGKGWYTRRSSRSGRPLRHDGDCHRGDSAEGLSGAGHEA